MALIKDLCPKSYLCERSETTVFFHDYCDISLSLLFISPGYSSNQHVRTTNNVCIQHSLLNCHCLALARECVATHLFGLKPCKLGHARRHLGQ